MFDVFFGFLGFIALIALIVSAVRQNARLGLMERELRALRSFVLSAPAPAPVSQGVNPEAPAASRRQIVDTPPVEPIAPAVAVTEESPPTEPAAEAPVISEATPPAVPPAASPSRPSIPARRSRPVSRPSRAGSRAEFETALGTRWAVWVGGVALALGGIFLVRYSIEAGFFGPAARLTFAALFGLAMTAGGEYLRRTGYRLPLEGLANAYIPAILTAAGAFTLFGTVYGAHAVYGFIGGATAYVLLGAIGLATIGLALLHGQALAGVGLLGALLTPLLVSSSAPNPWALFGYLAIVLVATIAVARIRRWLPLVIAAFAGIGLWVLLYVLEASDPNVVVILFIGLVQIVALAMVWIGGTSVDDDTSTRIPAAIVAASIGISVLALLTRPDFAAQSGSVIATMLAAAALAAAVLRRPALPLVFGAGIAVFLAFLRVAFAGSFEIALMGETVRLQGFADGLTPDALDRAGWVLAGLFLAVGLWQARERAATQPGEALAWSGFAATVSVAGIFALWFAYGNPDRDLTHALAALVLAVVLAAGAEAIARAEEPPLRGSGATDFALAGSSAATILMLHMAFSSGWTTITVAVAALLPALATRWRTYRVLGALCVAAAIVVLVRVAIDPTIVGSEALSRTPIFNWLLPGYGVPALAFAATAWQLRQTTNGRPQQAMEAAAALFALLTLAMLVRHAMNGGVLAGDAPTLAEQAIYSLIGLGAGGILIALDRRAPSSVFRAGSMILGVGSVAVIVLQHFLLLDPLFTEESTGNITFFNLLFLAYLLPGIAAGALALYARGRRPPWYAAMLGLTASVLVFAYATLSVRRLFKGEFIGLWSGFSQFETYSYSALWLVMGVALLVIGVRLASTTLRLASGVLIAIAVAKVFLFDMSELEGVLRALSFIGLGAVLIGIGLFYQRLLISARRAKEPL